MALPIKGSWARRSAQPYVYGNWGTGINSVHYQYGSAPVRQTPLHGEITSPIEGIPDTYLPYADWGYTPEDLPVGYFHYDLRPSWDVQSPDNPWRYSADDMPAVNATGAVKNKFRSILGGAYKYNWQEVDSWPSETVTEGWRNKPKGSPADAKPSDPSQYVIQTSMTQRYRTRNNDHAVGRATDDPRAGIESRVTGQKLKLYSGEQRHYDMLPYQQDDIPRAFYYRTAGTGYADEMLPNELYVSEPIERVPPPDPYIGQSEDSAEFGYTQEDSFYA